ncbi:MAG: hypothetical protein AAFY48_25970, partial [Bacteroidota bacterium]
SKDFAVLRGMKYWYYWNQLAEERASFTYRVENLDEVLPDLLRIGGFPTQFIQNHDVAKTTNTRPHSGLGWEDLRKEDEGLTKKIIEMAVRYGYQADIG